MLGRAQSRRCGFAAGLAISRLAERGFLDLRGIEQHVEADLVQELRLRRVVEHLETRSDIGLERKLLQQPRAEGVNRLHLEAARRLQRNGEQSPRPCAPCHIGRDVGGLPDRRVEFCIVEGDPLTQIVEHSIGHVGRGGLGEGDAEDLRRVDALEQEADHALRQNVRLARAGIGCDPGGDGRIGYLGLTL